MAHMAYSISLLKHYPQEEPMRAPTVTLGALVLALLGLAGCATLGDVRPHWI